MLTSAEEIQASNTEDLGIYLAPELGISDLVSL